MIKVDSLVSYVESSEFADLFIDELGWDNPVGKKTYTVNLEGGSYDLKQVASFQGFCVWVCKDIPAAPVQREISQYIKRKRNPEYLLIFANDHSSEWCWPRRSSLSSVNVRLMRHHHENGVPDPALEDRLECMNIGDDVDNVVQLIAKMRGVFNQESETISDRAARLMGGGLFRFTKA